MSANNLYEPGYIQAFGILLLISYFVILIMSINQNKKYFYYIPSFILILLYIIYEVIHMWFIDDTGDTDRILSSTFQLPQWTIMAFAYIFLILANQLIMIKKTNKK